MNKIEYIREQTQLSPKNIENTLQLLEEDCTIAFIARYRKDMTGNLDEVQIERIAQSQQHYEIIEKKKALLVKAIDEQGKLTATLLEKINTLYDLNELEDLYLPYKKKRKTRAEKAKELGLEPLAKLIMSQKGEAPEQQALRFCKAPIQNTEEALQGARDIIAEWINENAQIRRQLRRLFHREALIKAKVVPAQKDEESAQKYEQYFDWEEPLRKAAPHRLLALLRAQNEGIVQLSLQLDKEKVHELIEAFVLKDQNHFSSFQIKKAAADSYKRLLHPSLANEVIQEYKTKADQQSIAVFASNLTQLLLAAPLGEKRVLAIDPGFKTGCKIVCLDENGNLLYNETIYPHAPQKETTMASKKIRSMVNSYKIDAIAIGNGTASRETEAFIKKIAFDQSVQVFVVSEAGASIYSASKIAREEFPNYDITVRGAVSIGRRLQDPLAELVKIEPKSIGVGQYQHDVDQGLLKASLDQVVASSVNKIGVNLNTASTSLLKYVSGIGEKLAENIVAYRTENGAFTNRNDLKKVSRFGDKAFQQAAAFVRIVQGDYVLDNSAVHPEAYKTIEKMAEDLNIPLQTLVGNKDLLESINFTTYQNATLGEHYLKDMLKELEKPGIDPRKQTKILEFDPTLKTIHQVELNKVYNGIVNNITHFGCFVDIGIKESGLVHISQLKEGFVSDVNEVVKLHEHVQVKVIDVDVEKKRIQLSMIV